MSAIRVLETADIVVVLQDFDTDPLFVTFNEVGLVAKNEDYWGRDLFRKLNYSSAGVVSKTPNWYPAAQMDEICARILSHAAGRRVITYGHSQGGYGALKYAAKLKATCAVAFCPQWSIDPHDVSGFDRRFVKYHAPELTNGNMIVQDDLCEKNIVLFDPYESVDVEHVARLRQYAGIFEVIVPFSGHETVRIISEGGVSKEFIALLAAEAGSEQINQLRRVVRKARSHSPSYFRNRFSAILQKNHRIIEYLEFDGTIATKALKLCRLLSCGAVIEAVTKLAEMVDDDLAKVDLFLLWKFFRKINFPVGEYRVAGIMRRRDSNNTFKRLHFVNTCISLGYHDEAREELLHLGSHQDLHLYEGHVRVFQKALFPFKEDPSGHQVAALVYA